MVGIEGGCDEYVGIGLVSWWYHNKILTFFKIVEKLVNLFRDVVGSSVVVLLFHLV